MWSPDCLLKGGVVFNFLRGATSRKRGEIKLRLQLITNMKSYMDFRFVQKSMTLNDLERSKRICSHLSCAQRLADVSFTNLT